MERLLSKSKIETEEKGLVIEFEAFTTDDILLDSSLREQISSINNSIYLNQRHIDELNDTEDSLTNHSDKWDYLLSIMSGMIAGIIDSLFVGEFSIEKATNWGEEKVNKFVKKVANKTGYSGDDLGGAINHLEKKYPLASDSATSIFGGGRQHHLRDFAHHPNFVGLAFSLLTQYTYKVYGTDTSGRFIIESVPDKTLIGRDKEEKILFGLLFWIFHMVSDMAGSSSSISMGSKGTGLPGFFVAFLKEISSLPFFRSKDEVNKFSIWISKLFNGTLFIERDENNNIIPQSIHKIDLRAEIGIVHEIGRQSIPVIINECIVRGFYLIRGLVKECQLNKPTCFKELICKINWNHVIPYPYKNRTLSRMLTVSSAVFVAFDSIDAAIRAGIKSGGEQLKFLKEYLCRINIVGVGRLCVAVGVDISQDLKLKKCQSELMYLHTAQILLKSAKFYFYQANNWILAKDVAEFQTQLKEASSQLIKESIHITNENIKSLCTISDLRKQINEKNPKLLTDLSYLNMEQNKLNIEVLNSDSQIQVLREGSCDENLSKKVSTIVNDINSKSREIASLIDKAEDLRKKSSEIQEKESGFSITGKKDRDIIVALQAFTEEQVDQLVSLSQSVGVLFKLQKELSDLLRFLFMLACMNMTNNRTVVRQIEMQMKSASEEEINELAKQELENIIQELNAMNDMFCNIKRNEQCLQLHDTKIERLQTKLQKHDQNFAEYVSECNQTLDKVKNVKYENEVFQNEMKSEQKSLNKQFADQLNNNFQQANAKLIQESEEAKVSIESNLYKKHIQKLEVKVTELSKKNFLDTNLYKAGVGIISILMLATYFATFFWG